MAHIGDIVQSRSSELFNVLSEDRQQSLEARVLGCGVATICVRDNVRIMGGEGEGVKRGDREFARITLANDTWVSDFSHWAGKHLSAEPQKIDLDALWADTLVLSSLRQQIMHTRTEIYDLEAELRKTNPAKSEKAVAEAKMRTLIQEAGGTQVVKGDALLQEEIKKQVAEVIAGLGEDPSIAQLNVDLETKQAKLNDELMPAEAKIIDLDHGQTAGQLVAPMDHLMRASIINPDIHAVFLDMVNADSHTATQSKGPSSTLNAPGNTNGLPVITTEASLLDLADRIGQTVSNRRSIWG